MAGDQFDVTVRVEINKVRPDTGAWTGERMSVNQDIRIGVASWSTIADILARFHTLAETVQGEQGVPRD